MKKYENLLEKYRPKKLDDLIGQEITIKSIRLTLSGTKRPHMLFVGPPGTGKTSLANIIATEMDIPIIRLNASDERGIEVVRKNIKTVSRHAGDKIIFLDEADNMTSPAQMALRTIMETSTKLFILSANYGYKILEAIQSRCAYYDFKKLEPKHMMKMFKRIVDGEGMNLGSNEAEKSISKSVVQKIIANSGGDMRNFINSIQQIYDEEQNKIMPMLYVPSLIEQGLVDNIFETALEGNLDKALTTLVEHMKHNKDANKTLEAFYNHLVENIKKYDTGLVAGSLNIISQIENHLKVGCNPVIQISALISYIWGSQTKVS